jgi:outer membrane protein assembly factor BamE (lipoprotein component of BamABCDE complex)
MGTKRVHTHRWWVLIGMLPLLLQGCLVDLKERGMEIDPLLLAQLQPGLSTKADVLRVLGVPTRNAVIQDREAWIYDYSLEKHSVLFLGLYNEERKTMRQRGVAVLFADDRLYDYVFME